MVTIGRSARGSAGTRPGRSRPRPRPRSRTRPCLRQTEQDDAADPEVRQRGPPRPPRRRATSGRRRASTRSARGRPDPGWTNSGATSIDGWRRVSRTSARRAGVRRRRRAGSESMAGAPAATGGRRRVEVEGHAVSWGCRCSAAAVVRASGVGVRGSTRRRASVKPSLVASSAVSGPMQTAGIAVTSTSSAAASDRSPRIVEPLVNTTASNAVRRSPRAASPATTPAPRACGRRRRRRPRRRAPRSRRRGPGRRGRRG